MTKLPSYTLQSVKYLDSDLRQLAPQRLEFVVVVSQNEDQIDSS